MMKLRCTISGLDCPHCAMEIEEKLARLPGVRSASINFPMARLNVEYDEQADDPQGTALLERVRSTAAACHEGVVLEPCT